MFQLYRLYDTAGVMFIAGNGHGPGVILKKPAPEPASTTERQTGKTGQKKARPKRSVPVQPTV